MRELSILAGFQETVQSERRPSRFGGIYEPLPWPVVEWRVPVSHETGQVLSDQLVADGAPAFLTFDHAAAAFFAVAPPRGGRSFSGRECVVRQQDLRGRIESILVRPSEAIVRISGDRLGGAALSLGGFPTSTKRLRRETSVVRFPLPDGIVPGAWIALHRGSELIDSRALDPAWSGRPEVELELDPATEVEALISVGEAVRTEFKRQLPPDDRAAIEKVMKTAAAFANGVGGTIVFGVDDDGTIVGLDSDSPRKAIDRLTSLINDHVRPPVDCEVVLAEVHGKSVILARVQPGSDPPYGVGTTDRHVRYYVRRNGTSLLATPTDVRAFVRARLAASRDSPSFPWNA